MSAFYGHVLVRDSLQNDRTWPDPSPAAIIDRAIVVDGSGRRLIDEWRPDEARARFSDRLAGPIAWSRTPGDCWVIFDERIWSDYGTGGLTAPANSTLVDEGATVLRKRRPPGRRVARRRPGRAAWVGALTGARTSSRSRTA
jgi:hypothetical protein